MKVAIIGSGGREHAIAWKFAKSITWKNVFTLPGNGGIPNSHKVDISNFESINEFCTNNNIDLIFVGPEQALSDGIVDYFDDSNIRVFGPDKNAAQLEASKIFAKKFMNKYDISTANFKIFNSIDNSWNYILEKKGDIVIKFDGLAGGKGVFVCSNTTEAKEALRELEETYGKNVDFIVEDKIRGNEISIIAFTDGKVIKTLPISQDHKQLLENDKGPNTGGMGAFSQIDINSNLIESIQKTIINPTLEGINKEKMNYHGIIYFGIMIENNTPFLLEYNVRFGDPETEVLLPKLKNNLWEIANACINENLSEIEFEFEDDYFVDIVLASGGYPYKYDIGYEIKGLNEVSNNAIVFHAGTKIIDNKYFTDGGRVLNIVGRGSTLAKAITNANIEVNRIKFEGMYYRNDIGKRDNSKLI